MDIGESKLLNIHVTICDRPYRLKVQPEEEETVRKAAKLIAEKIKELQSEFAGSDKQDLLAMTALTMMVERLGEKHTTTEQVPATDILNELEQLDQHIIKALHP